LNVIVDSVLSNILPKTVYTTINQVKTKSFCLVLMLKGELPICRLQKSC